MQTTVGKAKVTVSLKKTIHNVLSQIGIDLSSFGIRGKIILLKPNFNTADPPPASTDIEFLKTVLELISEQNPNKVIIGESSTFRLRAKNVMREIGVYELQKIYPKLEILDFNDGKWIKKEIANGKYLKKVSIPEIITKVDKIILLPCCKTHFIGKFTGSIKLAVALMRPRERLFMHIHNVQKKIAELNTLYKPDLIIMDARKCFITNGPSDGEVRNPHLILASTDRIAIDIEGIKLIQSFDGNDLEGMKPEELPQIKQLKECISKTKNSH